MEWNTWTIVSLTLIFYWILCRSLRWRLATQMANKFKGRDPYSLSVAEAQWVVQQIFQLEMCYLSRFATAFALFRTYGIVSISQILLKWKTIHIKRLTLGLVSYLISRMELDGMLIQECSFRISLRIHSIRNVMHVLLLEWIIYTRITISATMINYTLSQSLSRHHNDGWRSMNGDRWQN